jgi:hypothetical protein
MSVVELTLLETIPVPPAPVPGRPGSDPILRVEASRHTIRLRRDLSDAAGGRRWLLELEVPVEVPDPEQTLAGCEDFLVDEVGGREIGVVDDVEKAHPEGPVSALVVAQDRLGRRRVRIEVNQIEVLIPAERRLIVREPQSGFATPDRRRA